MSWLAKILPTKIRQSGNKRSMPEGLWTKCPQCEVVLYHTDLENNLKVCPQCSHHFRIAARERLGYFLDADGMQEIAADVMSQDPLKFKDSKRYTDRLKAAKTNSGENDSLVVMRGTLKTLPVVAASFGFNFMAGSMGSVTGERFVRGVNEAIAMRAPFICFTASGGARMQEGLLSLMQMTKTNAAVAKLAEAKLPYINVLTDPTTGGVSASFAFISDVVIAEPNAMIGFAGERVIQNTVREQLPEGFQRAEFLMKKGSLDMICDRRELRSTIASLLTKLQKLPAEAAV